MSLPEPQRQQLLDQVRLLIQRLERISVDSTWARRSSGQRGALLRWAEQLETPESLETGSLERLQALIADSFKMLERAAREVPDPSQARRQN
ncbi:MAG: hypothetical protein AB1894_09245 [Chloroflexota bacterium]